MKLYIAGPWTRRDEARELATRLRSRGHVIVHDWWNTDDGEDPAYLRHCAWWDFIGITEADILVVLNIEKSEGKAVEQGIALAHGIPILGIGTRSNIFQHLQAYTWVPTVEDALRWFDGEPTIVNIEE